MSETSQRRGSIVFWAALAALAAALAGGYLFFLRGPDVPPVAEAGPDAAAPAPEPPDAEAPRARDLQVAEISGTVEIRSGKGSYTPAQPGAVLKADDSLRTSGDGRARLVSDQSFDVQVEPGTELEVQELTEQLSRVQLGLGMVVARVDGKNGKRLEVSARGSDAVAASTDGTFAVSSNGAGTVAVGARAGEVELKSAGKAVILRSGQQSVALPGMAPSDPTAIPTSLFLKVDWPAAKEINQRKVTVTGKTTPGAVVLLAGQPAKVDKDGRFKASLSLREGKNSLSAEGLDVGGHQAREVRELAVDTTAPETKIPTDGLWK
ncbi:MAG TPA: hypothetical protein VGK67_18440 [Myxococcales bacterium]|jgi:hypothetical protein